MQKRILRVNGRRVDEKWGRGEEIAAVQGGIIRLNREGVGVEPQWESCSRDKVYAILGIWSQRLEKVLYLKYIKKCT